LSIGKLPKTQPQITAYFQPAIKGSVDYDLLTKSTQNLTLGSNNAKKLAKTSKCLFRLPAPLTEPSLRLK